MATITSNSTGGGNWSAGTTWAGGNVPVDNDTVVIAAGDTVTFDVDTSAWANGIAGLTITSHATTPAMLRFKWDADGTYYLKLKISTQLAGTNAATFGRLLANGDGVWGSTVPLPYGRKAIIELAGTTAAYINAQYLDIALRCTEPTIKYAELYGVVYTVTASAATDQLTFTTVPSATPPTLGHPVTLSSNGGDLPGGLTAGVTYYVVDVSGATCKLATVAGGAAIDLTTDGTGTLYVHWGKWGPIDQAAAVNIATGVFTWSGPPPVAGSYVILRSTGTLPGGFAPTTGYYVRAVSGNTCKLALQNGDTGIVIPTSTGSGSLTIYVTSSAYATTVVNTLTDVTGDPQWTTEANQNNVALVDVGPANIDAQRLKLAAIAPHYLVLSAAVDSTQYAGALVWSVSRNVAIRTSIAGGSNVVAYVATSTHGGVFGCEIRATAGASQGYAINYGAGNVISGVISNFNYAMANGANQAITGVLVSNTYGISAASGFVLSGAISGCVTGINAGANATVSGAIMGCTSGISAHIGGNVTGAIYGCANAISGSGTGMTMAGVINSCTYGTNAGTGYTVSGQITGCQTGVLAGTGHIVAGTIFGCGTGIDGGTNHLVTGQLSLGITGVNGSSNHTVVGTISKYTTGIVGGEGYLAGATLTGNATDITQAGSLWRGWNTTLGSTTQVGAYKHASVAAAEIPNAAVCIADLGGVAGALGCWTLGGYCKSAAYAAGTHGTPPVTAPALIHEMMFEDSDRVTWVEYAVWGISGQQITLTVYAKLTGTSTFVARPKIGIYDPTKAWQAANEELQSSEMAANTAWQTLTVQYTPTWDRELRVRVQGTGGDAGGTGTEKLYWFHKVSGGGTGSGIVRRAMRLIGG